MNARVVSRIAVSVLASLLLAVCTSNEAVQSSRSPDAPATIRASSAVEAVGRALGSFEGHPALHGTLVLHTTDGDLFFEMWVREPAFRVELGAASGEPIPWVSDGTTSNMREPHVHAVAFLSTDPREIFRNCGPDQLRLIGRDEVLGRSVTVVSCRSSSEQGSYWIDDETGLVLKGERSENADSASWEFTALELNPELQPGLFVVPTEGT